MPRCTPSCCTPSQNDERRGLADVVGKLVVVEALGCLHRFAEDLDVGVAPGPEIVAERVDALGTGPRLVLLEEFAIASTPNVSVRAKEFRRWIDENSPYSGAEARNPSLYEAPVAGEVTIRPVLPLAYRSFLG